MNPLAPTRSDLAAQPFDNRSLFSDHYLTERLPGLPEWEEDVSAAWRALRALYERERQHFPGWNEAQLEKGWIQPVLEDVLGWSYVVQTPVTGVSGRKNTPDYSLFPDEADKQAAQARKDDERAFYEHAAAIAEAKYWERPLDSKVQKEVRDITNANPSFQIVSYLVASGVEWGVLTNGREWRLYSGRARSRIDTYYAVDLGRILEEEDEDAFRYFVLFFRAAAFRVQPETGRTFLQSVLEESSTYARELERRLKDLIFNEVFLHLARGFLQWRAQQGVTAESEETLDEIYGGTLRLLYRLLFLLHAEARDLLPRGEYSLTRIKRDVAAWLDADKQLSRVSDKFWNDLAGLFRRVDLGDPETGMPRYNGGLFREGAPRNRFLREHRMGDLFLAPALDKLARAGFPEFIDYKALNVEQLGSLYEGLLEFRLRLDENGEPFLENDKGERKATGSYYTPHYIVEYIVAETVGPVLAERVARFRELMEKITEKQGQLQRSRSAGSRQVLKGKLERLEADATDALLGIRVCDPAMGSGHFLVYATDWLTEQLMVVLTEYPDNPVLGRIAAIREQIVENLREQRIQVDPERLKDTNLLKRMVMKQCIYGVDLNVMATELAKLSLWLDSFTVGAPLSFLDHHLKTGNSLVGTRVDDMRHELESGDGPQFDAFGGPFAGLLLATKDMREVTALTDSTFEEVVRSHEKFEDYEETIEPYKRLLNLWLSRHFDNERAELMVRLYTDQVLDATRGKPTKLKQYHFKALEAAQRTAHEHSFFHWELEFPEVFIDLEHASWKEDPGFDAVIGNPPYGYRVTADVDPFMQASGRRAESENIAEYFVIQSLQLLRHPIHWGMIIPKQVLHTPSWTSVRQAIHSRSESSLKTVVDASEAFEDVLLEQVIVIAEKTCHERVRVGTIADGNILDSSSVDAEKFTAALWPIYATERYERLFESVWHNSVPLGNIAHLFFGVKNIKSKLGAASGVPMVIGDNIGRYTLVPPIPLLAPDNVTDSMQERYLVPKLIVQRIVAHVTKPYPRLIIMGTYDNVPMLAFDTVTAVVRKDGRNDYHYLLALINSRFFAWYFHRFIFNLSTRTMDFRKGFADHLPVRTIQHTTPEHLRIQLQSEVKSRYESYLGTGNSTPLDNLLHVELIANPGRTDVLHDLLTLLAEQMLQFHVELARLEAARDPFKYFSRSMAFAPLFSVFNREVKYGRQMYPLGDVHHDPQGLRLHPVEDEWQLEVLLKKRDPTSGWRSWERQEDGQDIAREWVPAYRFASEGKKMLFYQHAFAILDQFESEKAGKFPGGYRRSTLEKLQEVQIPGFVPSLDLKPLQELEEELQEVQDRIRRTDRLIDRVVYDLYGLTEDEIELVEGKAAD